MPSSRVTKSKKLKKESIIYIILWRGTVSFAAAFLNVLRIKGEQHGNILVLSHSQLKSQGRTQEWRGKGRVRLIESTLYLSK